MKKIFIQFLLLSILLIGNTKAALVDCNQFKKTDAKFVECKAKKLKKEFDKSTFKEKFLKFKNSKTLTKFREE